MEEEEEEEKKRDSKDKTHCGNVLLAQYLEQQPTIYERIA